MTQEHEGTDLPDGEGGAPGEPVIVGVDFTADTLQIALADIGGDLLHHEEHPFPVLPDEDAWAWEVGGRISTAFARQGERRWALGVGVACPGTVDAVAGRITDSYGQPDWDGLSVADALRRHINAPVVAINRAHAALRGETSRGAAAGAHDVLYVDLRRRPQAAIMASGRIVSGASGRAGALPAVPNIEPGAPLSDDLVQAITSLLADAATLIDPLVVVIEGVEAHVESLSGVLKGVLDEIAPGTHVVPSRLGQRAALVGALHAASIVAFEGERFE